MSGWEREGGKEGSGESVMVGDLGGAMYGGGGQGRAWVVTAGRRMWGCVSWGPGECCSFVDKQARSGRCVGERFMSAPQILGESDKVTPPRTVGGRQGARCACVVSSAGAKCLRCGVSYHLRVLTSILESGLNQLRNRPAQSNSRESRCGTPTMSKGELEFEVGELILAFHGPHIYPAKVRTLFGGSALSARAVETRSGTTTRRTTTLTHPRTPLLPPFPP